MFMTNAESFHLDTKWQMYYRVYEKENDYLTESFFLSCFGCRQEKAVGSESDQLF